MGGVRKTLVSRRLYFSTFLLIFKLICSIFSCTELSSCQFFGRSVGYYKIYANIKQRMFNTIIMNTFNCSENYVCMYSPERSRYLVTTVHNYFQSYMLSARYAIACPFVCLSVSLRAFHPLWRMETTHSPLTGRVPSSPPFLYIPCPSSHHPLSPSPLILPFPPLCPFLSWGPSPKSS